jgi:apolipoprotein N-acyltransferase
MGISAVIDPDGRVIELPRKLDKEGLPTITSGSWSDSKKAEGVVLGSVPIVGVQTLYARFGDWVAALCWTVVLVGLVVTAVRRSTAGSRT